MIASTVTTLSISTLVAGTAVGWLTTATMIRGWRRSQRYQEEVAIYDRAAEIYERCSSETPGSPLRVSDGLVLLAALRACGELDEVGYAEAKLRIIDGRPLGAVVSGAGGAARPSRWSPGSTMGHHLGVTPLPLAVVETGPPTPS